MPTPDVAAPSIHYTTIERKIPTWLKQAPTATLNALHKWPQAPEWLADAIERQPEIAKAWQDEHARHREHQAQVATLFEHIPDLESYAAKQLTDAIKQRFDLDLDVRNTYLIDARLIDTSEASDSRSAVNQASRTLLQSALHNFDKDAIEEHGMSAPQALLKRSVILDHRRFMGTLPLVNTLSIKAEAFADLCRTLDIGGKYHELVHSVYYPAGMPAPSASEKALATYMTLGRAEVSAFRQSLHFARLKGDISEAFYTQALATPLDQKQTNAWAMGFHLITLWESELTGVVLVSMDDGRRKTEALYIPEDNASPLKEFATRDALLAELRERLISNIRYLDKHIPDSDKARIIRRLEDRLTPWADGDKGLPERQPDPHATLSPVTRQFPESFQGYMAFQKSQRHAQDVLFHATPTEIVDRRAAQAHRELIASRALMALNIAGFFVPGLGELMLAVCVAQLAHEVYEGFDAWENDERDIACGYMVDVIKNVAIMLALHKAASALRRARGPETGSAVVEPEVEPITVETPSFIEELKEVELPDGSKRLWKPDLTPFAQQAPLPADTAADDLGLYRHDGKLWLRLDGKRYALKMDTRTGIYRIEHPSKPLSYAPALRHNGEGAWLHEMDRPREWHGVRLFRRLGHQAESFDDQDIAHILRVSDIGEGELRRTLSESQPIPAPLADTLARFKLDRETLQALPEASPGDRHAEFAMRYQQRPRSLAPGAQVLQSRYPLLPDAHVGELLRNASPSELESMLAGKVPRRIGEEVRLIQQQVRLMRAYEGLYLSSVDNPDTDRLILHTLQNLPGWPAETAIELRRGPLPAPTLDRIGAEDVPARIISRTPQGYRLAAQTNGLPDTKSGSIYQALFDALSSTQREALVPAGITDARTLAQHIQQSPLPRWALRKALKMQRPGPRSPMRLADGRLGYRLSGSGRLPEQPSRAHLLAQLEDIVGLHGLDLSAEQVLSTLEEEGKSPSEILERIDQLRAEREELRHYLNEAFAGPGRIVAPTVRLANRADIQAALWEHWINSAMPELEQSAGTLRLSRMFIAEFPQRLPPFVAARVRRLQLDNIELDYSGNASVTLAQREAQLSNLFSHFPDLSALEIERDYDPLASTSQLTHNLPLIVHSFPRLIDLRLRNQNLALSSLDLELFSTRDLRHLDLSGNSVAALQTLNLDTLHLDYLGLDRTALMRWPAWLNQAVLDRISTLSLRDNRLAAVPTFVRDNPQTADRLTLIQLQGNPLSDGQRLALYISRYTENRRFSFTLDTSSVTEDYRAVRDVVDPWPTAATPNGIPNALARQYRMRVRDSILDFWERLLGNHMETHLRLDAMRLEDFPSALPAVFYDRTLIIRLTRTQMTAEQLDQWLQPFQHITYLALDGHIQLLQALPEALATRASLYRLDLVNHGLLINDQMLRIITRIPALSWLDLSGNLPGPTMATLVRQLPRLNRLALRNMNFETWPDWLNANMPRDALDLRDNRLTTLPQAILDNPHSHTESIGLLLEGNPLTEDTMRTAYLSQRNDRTYTFDMDVTPDFLMALPIDAEDNLLPSPPRPGVAGDVPLNGHAHPHWRQAFEPDVQPWLEGAGDAARQTRSQQWSRLHEAGDADHLLQLVTRLTQSRPYHIPASQPALIERVWRVLDMADTQVEQRLLFNALAMDAILDNTCEDGMLLQFQQVEQAYFTAMATAETEGPDREANLFDLLRRLFRQERLDRIALRHVEERHSLDAVEVRLAYRRHLATALRLLSPADEMTYGADVDSQDATAALLEILEAEDQDEFIDFALRTPFWTDYLRDAYADDFTSLERAFEDAVEALSAQDPEASQDSLAPATRALEQQRDRDVREQLDILTYRIRNQNHASST